MIASKRMTAVLEAKKSGDFRDSSYLEILFDRYGLRLSRAKSARVVLGARLLQSFQRFDQLLGI